jgi:hypothetical protein
MAFDDDSSLSLSAQAGLGAEFKILPQLSLRAQVAYRWYNANIPLNTLGLSLGVCFNLNEILHPQTHVSGEMVSQQPVFPVNYSWYEDHPFATIKIVNNEPNAIRNVHVSIYIERYMNQPSQFASIESIAKGVTKAVPVPVVAVFNEAMLSLTANTTVTATITIEYHSLGAKKTTSFAAPLELFNRNAMSWDDDRRAASFVSARDPAAVLFAKYTASIVHRDMLEHPDRYTGIPVNIIIAAALFDTLHLYGLTYVVDPASSYTANEANASAIDSLNYPYQTLQYRGGDCDDLSILFCSLLEVLDIPTAFITIPGHIFMAFGLSGNVTSLATLPFKDRLIQRDNRYWLPVEITIPQEGFTRAVATGVSEWAGEGGAEAQGGSSAASVANWNATRKLYPMTLNWKVYPPVSVPEAGSNLPTMPSGAEILDALRSELRNW